MISTLSLEHTPLIVLPGVFAALAYGLFFPQDRRNWSNQLLEVAAYGFLNYIAWHRVIDELQSRGALSPWCSTLGLVGTLVVSPSLLGAAAAWSRQWTWLARVLRSPLPTSWDHAFSRTRLGERWIRIHLKDGRMVGGLLREGSHASAYPHPQDVFVKEQWSLSSDGRFRERIEQSGGILIRADDCVLMEFFELKERS